VSFTTRTACSCPWQSRGTANVRPPTAPTIRRVDTGHLDIEVTYTDPGAFRTPLTITQKLRLLPDQQLLEYFCADNEKDRPRYFTTK
jgi:hypothetical protein